ncbi:xanthine dehydrogenase family protein subunit M [Candidatus Palauibacter soopunensis]|uniref:FAD binding domain-containing protein n=1 Tax=Candidatus Palauibacter soopunensis TaxID=3056739 RepID=UPI00238BCA67|nr:xanthine dehydrogenase family protein subunit M [Candidatus Palauibacter soopunensis]MDE2879295.1 xanthine dehydrogenase family protein subunit M [Candidatus Palauibacter soopunensis]
MIPPQFDYHAPAELDDAIDLLGELDDAKVMSGGQSLLPMMKLRLAAPANIIDIGRIPGLDTIEERDGCLRIGALVTEAQLEESAAVVERYPILIDTARVIADPLVRNRATVCGNIAHGDPANDHPATMLALRAHVIATGPGGERTIDIDDFFHGLFMTALGEDEILTELHIPVPPAGSGGAYVKLERKVGDYAVAGAAVQLTLDDDGKVTKAGVALTNLSFAPIRATAAEETLLGADFVPASGLRGAIERVRDAITKAPDADEIIAAAAQAAADMTEPVEDRRGSVEYKRNMARVLTARAIRQALARAGAGG